MGALNAALKLMSRRLWFDKTVRKRNKKQAPFNGLPSRAAANAEYVNRSYHEIFIRSASMTLNSIQSGQWRPK
jgi:hypothetical protein